MPLELNLNADDINRFVAEAIANSAIGDAVRKSVEEALKGLTSGYDKPLNTIIQNEVRKIAANMVHDRYKADIEAQVIEIMKEQTTDTVIRAVVSRAFKDLISERY